MATNSTKDPQRKHDRIIRKHRPKITVRNAFNATEDALMLGKQKESKPIRENYCMVVKEGYDLQEVKVAWAEACRYQTVMKQLRVSISSTAQRELLLEWFTQPETIGHNMAQLKKRPEYAGVLSVIDLHESERTSAFQEEMRQRQANRLKEQEQEEGADHLAKLQPPVCSLDGIFRAAELGDLAALDALITGYPLPVYDHHTGTARPNPDRLAMPEDRHQIRVLNQRAHTTSLLQHRHAESQAVGDPMEDLRLAAPHLFRGGGTQGAVAASFDLRDGFGKTPLHIATAAGQLAMMERLLALGADASAEDREGVSCVQMAALRGDVAGCKALLRGGADMRARAGDGRSVLHFACAGGSEAFVDWLLFGPETVGQELWRLIGERSAEGASVLHALARADASTKERQYGVNGVAKKLFRGWLGVMERHPAELLNAADDTGATALHACAAADSFELLRYLTSLGADPNLQARNGDIAMHVAIRKQTVPSITFLASAGSDTSIANRDGDTPLHVAAACPNKAVFKLCMQSLPPKADPPVHRRLNAADEAPLHIAARRCGERDERGESAFHDIVQYAVLNRADPCQPNSDGVTPIMAAAEGGNPATVSFLCRFTMDEHGGNSAIQATNGCGENAFVVAARHGQVDSLRALHAAGVDIRCVSRTRTSAVSEAAAHGHEEALRYLISLGLDVAAKDLLGRSPLHWAAKGGHARVCEMLVEELQCDVDERDRGLATPLLGAVVSKQLEVVRVLVKLGARPDAAARDRSTPLSECTSEEMREVLEEAMAWQSGKLFVRRELTEAEAEADKAVTEAMEGTMQTLFAEKEEGWRRGKRRSSIAARGRRPSVDRRCSAGAEQEESTVLAQLQQQYNAAEALSRRPSAQSSARDAVVAGAEKKKRALTDYTKLPPVHRPAVERALAPGSALHSQVLRIEQQAAYPRPDPAPPSTATTAGEAFVETLGLHGPLRGVDLAWASMRKSPLWLAEHAPARDLAAQREHTLYLQALQRSQHAAESARRRKTALRRGLDPEHTWRFEGRELEPLTSTRGSAREADKL